MKKLKLLKVIFDLFDGEGGAAASAEGGETQGEQIKYESTRHTQKGDTVMYGKQESAADSQPMVDVPPTSNTLEDKRKSFKDLIQGEYKDQYAEETQRIINRRFKETKGLEDTISKWQPVMDILTTKYGKEGEELVNAINNDNQFWEEIAEANGMSVEQYKEYTKLQRENEVLRKQQEAAQQNEFRQNKVNEWVREADLVKAKYEKFDFQAEINNPEFMRMLEAGTPMEHAYKVVHFDELMADERGKTEKAVVDQIRAKGMRPIENGTANQSGFTVKDNVHKLSKADRAEIARRVARGEKISF